MITLVCPEHRTYLGEHRPHSTTKHIDGCLCCWVLYHAITEGQLVVLTEPFKVQVTLKVKRS